MNDLIIIGSGPAGLSAALTAKKRNLSFVWFGNKNLSQKVLSASRITNYPGLIDISGEEMVDVFKKQIEHEKLEIIDKKVNNIARVSDKYMVSAGSDVYEGKTIILAIGVDNKKSIEGEEGFVGKGVSYCATCDGMFYRGKDIAVLCTNKEYEEEVEFLAGLVNKLYLFVTYDTDIKLENADVIKEKPAKIMGDTKVFGISYNESDGVEKSIDIDGIFILRDVIKPNTLLKSLAMDGNNIAVNRKQETNLPGVFAAGDCTGRPYQYTKAVGEGNVCIQSVVEYLAKNV